MKKFVFKQPITDNAKVKFLEWCLKDNAHKGKELLRVYLESLKQGYYENLDGDYTNELEALNIWEEPIPFGIFWDNDDDEYIEVGFMIINQLYPCRSDNKYTRHINGKRKSTWDNFKEIKTMEELREYRESK